MHFTNCPLVNAQTATESGAPIEFFDIIRWADSELETRIRYQEYPSQQTPS